MGLGCVVQGGSSPRWDEALTAWAQLPAHFCIWRSLCPEATGWSLPFGSLRWERPSQFSGCSNGWTGLGWVFLRGQDWWVVSPALEGKSKLPRQPDEWGIPTKGRLPTSCQDNVSRHNISKHNINRELTRWAVLISLRASEIKIVIEKVTSYNS